jgi:hypothetical protein
MRRNVALDALQRRGALNTPRKTRSTRYGAFNAPRSLDALRRVQRAAGRNALHRAQRAVKG